MCWSLFWKLGANFGTSSLHLSNSDRILRIIWKEGVRMGPTMLNPESTYVRSAWPTHLSRQAKKPFIDSPTPLSMYDDQALRKLGCLCVNSLKLVVWDETHGFICCTLQLTLRYVGVIWFLFVLPNVYRLDLYNKSHVALANLRWNICKNHIENQTAFT